MYWTIGSILSAVIFWGGLVLFVFKWKEFAAWLDTVVAEFKPDNWGEYPSFVQDWRNVRGDASEALKMATFITMFFFAFVVAVIVSLLTKLIWPTLIIVLLAFWMKKKDRL